MNPDAFLGLKLVVDASLAGPRGAFQFGDTLYLSPAAYEELKRKAAAGEQPRRTDVNDRQALLRAILESPYDYDARLVYADWLEEHGEGDRAGLIRESVAGRTPTDPAEVCLLVPGGVARWNLRSYEVAGGFVMGVSLHCDDFMRHAGEIFAEHPVTHVTLIDRFPREVAADDKSPDGWRWGWDLMLLGGSHEPHRLPFLLCTRLSGFTGKPFMEPPAFRYPSPQEAEDAVSRSCVRFGRHKAGLPPLDAFVSDIPLTFYPGGRVGPLPDGEKRTPVAAALMPR